MKTCFAILAVHTKRDALVLLKGFIGQKLDIEDLVWIFPIQLLTVYTGSVSICDLHYR